MLTDFIILRMDNAAVEISGDSTTTKKKNIFINYWYLRTSCERPHVLTPHISSAVPHEKPCTLLALQCEAEKCKIRSKEFERWKSKQSKRKVSPGLRKTFWHMVNMT